ncbi:MAG TPA: SGNH/GDSL hydrolase family protein [Acidobacteriota bacterium]|nr:SGNH/GDSL hydrolase family protein [Acidobacteriota bacterium]
MLGSKKILGAVVILLLLAGMAAAEDYYGPQNIQVNGAKKIVRAGFKAPAGRAAWVEVSNGVSGGNRAAAVIVVLNGNRLNKRKELNKKVGSAIFPVLLQSGNKIKVIVRGNGAKVNVQVKSRSADFNRLAGYGDSLLAGFEDGSLVETYQVWNFGSQIANIAGAKFTLPLIAEPGLPPRYRFENGQLIIPDANGPIGYRKNPDQDPDNLSVPGATVWTSLNVARIGATLDPYVIVLGGQRSMMGELKHRKPTFVLLWIGSNDILDMATNTDPSDHTALNDFKRDYETILKEIRDLKVSAVAANLPDVTAVAFLFEPTSLHLLAGVPANVLMPITKLLDFDLPPDDYLSPDEVAQIRNTIQQFNTEIEKLCEKYGVPVVDFYSVSQQWDTQGATVGGQHLTAEWRKGIFSLDGIHPSNTGHALIANLFIAVINKAFGANLAMVNVAAVLNQDPNRPASAEEDSDSAVTKDSNFLKDALRVLTHSNRIRRR